MFHRVPTGLRSKALRYTVTSPTFTPTVPTPPQSPRPRECAIISPRCGVVRAQPLGISRSAGTQKICTCPTGAAKPKEQPQVSAKQESLSYAQAAFHAMMSGRRRKLAPMPVPVPYGTSTCCALANPTSCEVRSWLGLGCSWPVSHPTRFP